MAIRLALKDAIELYEEGEITLSGVYASCDTDLEFYNFLHDYEEMDEDDIKDTMCTVSGADDAYYNALSHM